MMIEVKGVDEGENTLQDEVETNSDAIGATKIEVNRLTRHTNA